jgi:hypothetical protein
MATEIGGRESAVRLLELRLEKNQIKIARKSLKLDFGQDRLIR